MDKSLKLSLQNDRKSQKINNIIYHSLAENTWLAYQKGRRRFETYYYQTKQASLPASAETVVDFLMYLLTQHKNTALF